MEVRTHNLENKQIESVLLIENGQTNTGENTGSLAEILKQQDGKQYCQFRLGH